MQNSIYDTVIQQNKMLSRNIAIVKNSNTIHLVQNTHSSRYIFSIFFIKHILYYLYYLTLAFFLYSFITKKQYSYIKYLLLGIPLPYFLYYIVQIIIFHNIIDNIYLL
jgi:lipopolysaccharide export LptBFGC system permease protein LptF